MPGAVNSRLDCPSSGIPSELFFGSIYMLHLDILKEILAGDVHIQKAGIR